ncbi:MAG: hypothetical protein IV090_12585 [Candidatus Sericytochromatia bacterium]|nr:hypothetical protein [Candidatus Sericytochromatia bacterium]
MSQPLAPLTPIRSASAADNAALLALSAEVPVSTPAFAYTLERSPDFFAFARAQAPRSDILVAGQTEDVKGFISVCFNRVWLEGRVQDTVYTGDLRVAQAARGWGLGDQLMQASIALAHQERPLPVFNCVLKDNPVGLKMNANLAREGITEIVPIGDIGLTMLFPLLGFSKPQTWGFVITRAQESDFAEMFELWQAVKSKQHLARAWDRLQWRSWIEATPGLALSDYLLARNAQGELCGFFAVWNQQPIRRVRLRRVHPLLSGARRVERLLRTTTQTQFIPGQGDILPVRQVLNLCIAGHAAKAFPALLEAALSTGKDSPFLLGIALDRRDPLQYWLDRFAGSRSELVLLSNYRFVHPGRGLFHLEIGLG